MKKFFALLLITSTFFTFSASAQNMKGGAAAAKQRLIDSLKLSPAQADSVVAIRQRTMPQIKSVMSDNSLTQEQKKAKAKSIKGDMKAQLRRILSNDQMMKLQEMEMNMKQNKDNNS